MAVASTSSLSLTFPAGTRTTQLGGHNSSKLRNFRFCGSSYKSSMAGRPFVIAKATPSDQNPKPKSVICTNCDGNGAVLCSQCKGSGVNSVDVFGGQFKAGDSCWLCGGKKDMLCGDCNGAGFIGGFMSTFDE